MKTFTITMEIDPLNAEMYGVLWLLFERNDETVHLEQFTDLIQYMNETYSDLQCETDYDLACFSNFLRKEAKRMEWTD